MRVSDCAPAAASAACCALPAYVAQAGMLVAVAMRAQGAIVSTTVTTTAARMCR